MGGNSSGTHLAHGEIGQSFADLLRRYREVAGLTQEALAERAGLSWRTVSDLERGLKHTPRHDTLDLLIAALDLSPEQSAAFRAAGRRKAAFATEAPAALPADTGYAPRNPYKGLRPFRGDDAHDFFGREDLVSSLLASLGAATPAAPRFLALVGPSGSGKSSAVLAGLLPRLHQGALPGSTGWQYLAPVLPGAHPLESLTVALSALLPDTSLAVIRADLDHSPRGLHLLGRRLAPRQDARVLLVVDQGEELFTLTGDEEERRRFIDLLVTAVTEPDGPVQAIITLRADFYDRPMHYPTLGRLLETHTRAVLPMTVAELRAAIERPAAQADTQLSFEAGLVDDLLFEVQGQAGALPLLQFTLDQLYQRRDGRLLTVAAYRALGGVRGALARQAEATYAELPTEDHRRLARALFLRLIDPGAAEQETTRRRAAIAELLLPDPQQADRMRAVAGAFVNARLLTTGAQAGVTTLEVSHEALIREWKRLGDWLREARDDVLLQQRLSEDAASWQRRGRPVDHLYRGLVLDEALAWVDRNAPSAGELEFLTAGLDERRRQEAEERARQANQLTLARQSALANRRAAQRLRSFVAVLVVSLVLVAGLSGIALKNAATATTNAHREAQARATAVADRAVAQSRQLAAQALGHVDDRYDLAVLLAVAANQLDSTIEARDSLLRTLAYNPQIVSYLHGAARPVTGVALSPDGLVLAAGHSDGTLQFWDLAHRRPLGPPLPGPAQGVYNLVFSPDGKRLLVGGYDGTIRLWDVARRVQLGSPLRDGRYPLYSVALSANGTILASGSTLDTVVVWDLAHRQPLGRPLVGGGEGVPAVALSLDGKEVAAGSIEGTVVVWNLVPRRTLYLSGGGHIGVIASLAFSPDGRILAAGGESGIVRLWDVARGQALGPPLTGHTEDVTSLAFSPDGKILVSGSADATVRLWDVAHQRPLGPPLLSHAGGVTSVAFDRDDTTIAVGSEIGLVLLWSVAGRPSVGQLLFRPLSSARSVDVNARASAVALGTDAGAVDVWRLGVPAGREPLLAVHPSDARSLALNRDSTMLAAGSDDGSVHLWEARDGHVRTWQLGGQTGGINALAFSPNGAILATGSDDTTIRLWDVARRAPIGRPLTGHTYGVTSLSFSTDGHLLASGSYDGTARLWDIRRGRALGPPLPQGGSVNSVAFSADGRMLASGNQSGAIQLWDIAGHRPQGVPLSDTAPVTGLAFTPDGTTLAAGNVDGTIQLWDLASRRTLGPPLAGHSDAVTRLVFSADGRRLLSGSLDGSVRQWSLEARGWIREACRLANRSLTRQEWRQYLGDQPYRAQCPSGG